MEKIRGRIFNGGIGCFLTPPNYPNQRFGVKMKDRYCSLDYVKHHPELFDDNLCNKVKTILNDWFENKPSLKDDAVKTWIYSVLKYFANVYSIDGKSTDVNDKTNCVILEGRDQLDYEHHMGVLYIRKFYPEYIPTDEDFINAKMNKRKGKN